MNSEKSKRWRRRAQALLAAAPLAAALVAGTTQAGEVRQGALRSQALGAELRYSIYLPDGYGKGEQRYPVVYLLHGAGGNESDWLRLGGAAETLDGLIRRGQLRPSIVVMPTLGPLSWYVDGAAAPAATAFIDDLLPHVEAQYRAAPGREQRSIAGLSMGGYGALNLSLRYPAHFCAAGLISPAIYEPLPPEQSTARRSAQFMSEGRFDPALWQAHSYAAQLAHYAQSPYRVPLWIVAGDHDALGIAASAAQLFWRLLPLQPKQAELRVVDGDHEWMMFRDALPDTLRYMNDMCQKALPAAAPG